MKKLLLLLCVLSMGFAYVEAQEMTSIGALSTEEGLKAEVSRGDYMEIGGRPAVVFYVDESGRHGLAMSYNAFRSEPKGMALQVAVNKSRLKKEQYKEAFLSNIVLLDTKKYEKAGNFKKKQKKAIFTELCPLLGRSGEKNALAIADYCKKKGLSMEEYFPWEYWATQLGEGWFIPGDEELTQFVNWYAGGLNEKIKKSPYDRPEELSSNKVAQSILLTAGTTFYFLSSTASLPEFGFNYLFKKSKGVIGTWYELIDRDDKGLIQEKAATVFAVHKF